jgi:hypothetical protein
LTFFIFLFKYYGAVSGFNTVIDPLEGGRVWTRRERRPGGEWI